MDILVVGCGSIGRRHIGNFRSLKGVGRVRACDMNPERLKIVKEKFPEVETTTNFEEALDKGPCGVAVCTPPHIHTPLAMAAVRRGYPVMMEKPFAMTADGVEELLLLADEKNLPVMTAYCLRFWTPLIMLKEMLNSGRIGRPLFIHVDYSSYLPEWHPWEDYRAFYMAKKSQGGGAILDDSHAIDFTRWLMGEVDTVACFNDHISALEIDSDDIAEILLRFKSGAIGSIHLDLFSRTFQSALRIEGEDGILEWDRFDNNEVRWYDPARKIWETTRLSGDTQGMYIKEAEHFLECVERKKTPLIDGWEGYRTLRTVLACIESSKTQRMVKVREVRKAEGAGKA